MSRTRRICTIDGCERVRHSADYCKPHYYRDRDDGDPQRTPVGKLTVEARPSTPVGWRDSAACKDVGAALFFYDAGENIGAKEVCSECAVRADCLQDALDNDERFGVWGGMAYEDRKAYRKRHGSTVTVLPPVRFGYTQRTNLGRVIDLEMVRRARVA